MSVDAVVHEVMRTGDFLRFAGGGVTFSGGEPLAQPDFVCEIADRLHAEGLPLAIETSGYASEVDYQRVVGKVDMVFQDLKHPDPHGHLEWTGVEPELIWRNLAWLKSSAMPFVARIPLMPGVNDSREDKNRFADLLMDANGLERVELLPYNRLAGAKYAKLGRVYAPGFDEERTPDMDVSVFTERGMMCVAM